MNILALMSVPIRVLLRLGVRYRRPVIYRSDFFSGLQLVNDIMCIVETRTMVPLGIKIIPEFIHDEPLIELPKNDDTAEFEEKGCDFLEAMAKYAYREHSKTTTHSNCRYAEEQYQKNEEKRLAKSANIRYRDYWHTITKTSVSHEERTVHSNSDSLAAHPTPPSPFTLILLNTSLTPPRMLHVSCTGKGTYHAAEFIQCTVADK